MKRLLISILSFVALCVYAQQTDTFKDIRDNYRQLGGTEKSVLDQSPYSRIELADSVVIEYFVAKNITVVYTACAPRCSSCAYEYTKEWQLIKTIKPPFTSVFPIATIDQENGRIIWTDNDDWKY